MAKAQILIVEDDGIVAIDIQNSLQKLGFSVIAMVPSGEEALEKVEEYKPDLVLMDIMLKGEMNGTEAAKQIRSQFNIPIVYLTAYAEEGVLERAKVTEPFGYIIKPFEDRELNTAIEMALYKHRMEKRLKESEEWLSTTLKSIGDAVIATDTKGNVIFMNAAAESLTRWQQEEATGRPLEIVFNIINEETMEKVENPVLRVLREGIVVGLADHTLVIAKDGTEIPIDDSGSPIRDDAGDITGVVLVFHDVSERRHAEKALQESEERYRALFEYNPIGTIIVDNEAKIVMYNFAKDKSEGEGRLPNIGDVMYKDYAGKHEINMHEELMKCIRSDDKKEFPELKYKDQFLHIRISPFSGGAIITSIDITAMKRLHDQLQQSEKMEAIGTLAGGIAHEFNNILGIIIGNTELAIDDVPEWNPAKECLKEIRAASMRAKEVVRQILSFARKSLIARKPVRVSPIIEETLKLMRASIPTTIDVRDEISCEWDTVLADLTQLNQILMNLCTNAAHAMRKEGGVLEVCLENVEFGIQNSDLGLEPGTYVKLTVKDTGHGIDPEIMDRIFEPYFTTKGQAEGTGMGLAVVHGIVKSYDGTITVQSEAGKGAVFEVLIPVIDAEVLKEIEKEDELPTGDECILFVDDEEALVRAYTLALKSLGYKVVSFNNPLEALEAFQKDPEKFDLIITDLTMPHITGDKLAKEMMEIRSDIPVILCSGYSEPISDDKVSKLGIKAYVTKPFIKRDLARVVRRALADNCL